MGSAPSLPRGDLALSRQPNQRIAPLLTRLVMSLLIEIFYEILGLPCGGS